jgi:hypothetical protein
MSATLGGAFGFFVLSCVAVWCFGFCAGIRDMTYHCTRRPCAGRHLLFFAAAKKSRQKKAAHTASSSICPRAPTGSYASHGNHVTDVRCQRSRSAPHPRHAPAVRRTVPDSPRPPRWQTVCRPKCSTRHTSDPEAHGVPPRKSATLYDGTTYTQFAAIGLKTFAKINSKCGRLKRVMRLFKALATHANKIAAA